MMEERGRDRLTSGIWERALDKDDELAKELFDRAYKALGAGVASAVNLIDPEAVIFGGGLGTALRREGGGADRQGDAPAPLRRRPPAGHQGRLARRPRRRDRRLTPLQVARARASRRGP